MKLIVFRSVVLLSAVAVAFYSVLDGVAAVERATQPDRALGIIRYDALAQAQLASRMQIKPETATDPATAMALAKTALRREPGSATAVRVIGFVKLSNGDVDGAIQALNYTHALTRRDLAAELWLIEYNVQLGRVRQALNHFDAALGTSREIQLTLLPVLATAIADPRLIRPMEDFLANDRWWRPWALFYLAQGPAPSSASVIATPNVGRTSAANVLNLFERLARRGEKFQPETRDALLARFRPGDTQMIVRTKALPLLADAATS